MTNIGAYGVVRLLGKGGMSEVYEVESGRLGSHHALKLFTYDKDDPEVRERFLAEGKLLSHLNHPRVVKVTDLGLDEASGRPYFVMDLIRDERGQTRSLADVQPGMADEEEIGRWYDDLREGLEYIHANGVIHRDLKLQNVLIGPDGHAVLTDFGISKVCEVAGKDSKAIDTVSTIVKMREGRSLVMGSIGYMAPELEMGVAASPQSDWYALGVIVYRLLTGTWCDARTDIAAALETYDPVWRRILPKLLHSNPQGRECLSYAGERKADQERALFEAEDRWLKAKAVCRQMRWVAGGLLLGLLTVAVAAGILLCRERADAESLRQANASLSGKLALPVFSEVCKVPEEAMLSGNMWAKLQAQAALIDTWVLTHSTFDDLREDKITLEKAIETIDGLAEKAEANMFSVFPQQSGYIPRGDMKVLVQILKNAAAEMKQRQHAIGQPVP